MIEKIKKEIQRQLQESEERLSHINARGFVAPNEEQLIVHLKGLLSFIETHKVKEVDLEKELDKFYGMYRKDGQTFSLEDNEECVDWKVDCNPKFEKAFAKHFFELGLKTQKGE